ncbi:MAG TPA: cytochrome P450, partial [Acidimicrobiia bacterium]|nr:cytochrome P450 [Acidimicrobiia bacterium]
MTVTYNPFDPDQVDHDREIVTQLRHEAPVVEIMPGVFYVTRYENVVEISRDAKRFPQAPFSPLEEDTRTPDELQLGESNPPGHTKIRKILASVLSPPRIRAIEPFVDSVCRELIDGLASKGSADLIADLGRPLPAQVIGELTGVPFEDRSFLHDYSDLVVHAVQDQDPIEKQRAVDRVAEFDRHFLEVIRERRNMADKPDDAMTALIEYRDEEGKGLSDEKVLLHLTKDLITGGIDTTTHLVGNLFYDLCSTPGAYARVRDDRTLVPTAVEEALRHIPIVNVLFRRPVEDQVVGGVTIPAGSTIALGYTSANHDETVFPDPERYDLDRGEVARRHLGFGWGVHLCVGAPLARVEGAHV